jgi:hypothetical protein
LPLAAKHITKNVAKRLGKAAKAFGARTAAAVGIDTGMTILIVGRAFLGIGKHLVSFFGFLEFFFGNLVSFTLVAVRVVFHRELAVRFFYVFIAGVLGNAQRVVIVFFGHVRSGNHC